MLRDAFDFRAAHRRLDEQHVGARFAVAQAALERRFETFDRDRVAARDDREIRIDARIARRADLRHHLGGRDHPFACEVAAALRPGLVFDVHTRNPGALVIADRAPHVDGVAVARVSVGDDREAGRVDDAAPRYRPFRSQ